MVRKRRAEQSHRDTSPSRLGTEAPDTITVRVPLTVRHRGGRKLVVSPNGDQHWTRPQTRVDSTLVKALARAHQWKEMMESGYYAS